VPVGTARALGTNVPVGGGFFRLFPDSAAAQRHRQRQSLDRQPLVLYVHPWEFDPAQPRPPMPWLHRFRHYVGLAGADAQAPTPASAVPVHHDRGRAGFGPHRSRGGDRPRLLGVACAC
jgi:hypothetical protein